jgi:hypothetical protein
MPQTDRNVRTPLVPKDLGSMRNVLGILTDDHKRFRPQRLSAITGLGASELSRAIQKSRPMLYEEELPLKLSSDFAKSIFSLVIATDLAHELFEENQENTTNWLMTPNSLLFGDSPFVVCMRGDGAKLIEWLNTRLGKLAGAAF